MRMGAAVPTTAQMMLLPKACHASSSWSRRTKLSNPMKRGIASKPFHSVRLR
jgi:hypothetical protein